MKRTIALFLAAVLTLFPVTALAARGGIKGPPGGTSGSIQGNVKYTILVRTTNFGAANGFSTMSWDTTADTDEVGAFSGGSPTIMTVPKGITKAKVTLYITWENQSTNDRRVLLLYNGAANYHIHYQALAHSDGYITTAWLPVVKNDTFSVQLWQNGSAGNLQICGTCNQSGNISYFQIEWAP